MYAGASLYVGASVTQLTSLSDLTGTVEARGVALLRMGLETAAAAEAVVTTELPSYETAVVTAMAADEYAGNGYVSFHAEGTGTGTVSKVYRFALADARVLGLLTLFTQRTRYRDFPERVVALQPEAGTRLLYALTPTSNFQVRRGAGGVPLGRARGLGGG